MMTRTPDEIKKGLECHARPCGCDMGCPYVDECREDEGCPTCSDALALIQQLEKDNDQLRNYIRLLQAERDAAVAELANSDSPCDFCKYLKKFAHETPCNNCVHVLKGEESQFKWRGVQKEE